jgi:beta-lactam-binding protein with PASTA domain
MAGETFVVEGFSVKSGEPVGTVVSQDPKPGETAGEGATISVRVSGRSRLSPMSRARRSRRPGKASGAAPSAWK